MIEALVRDLRHAARGLARTPSFTATAVLTLAIGIGATTAVFSVVYGVLLRPLPFPTADRLVQVVQLLPDPAGGAPARAGLTPGQIAEWRATSRTLAEIGSYASTALSLTGVPLPLRLNGSAISVPLFRALGVPPIKGRTLGDDDETTGNERVVLLSHALWMGRFGGSDEMLERTLTLGGQPYRVIGVMPRGFSFPSLARPGMSLNADGALSDAPEFWIPMVKEARPSGPVATGGMTLVTTFALLAPGITVPQATAEANSLMPARVDRRFQIEIVSARGEQGRDVRRVLLIFQAAVLFVLFIACANLTNLLLARAASRRRELAVRLAIGASRIQLARFALSESALIGAAGGLGGCALAFEAVALLRTLPPYVLPRLSEIRVDGAVLALACAIAIGSGLLVGLWTTVRMLQAVSIGSGRPHRPSRILVVAETAAGVLLLAGAALLLTSFVRLTRVDRGLDPTGVFTFRVSLPARLQAPAAQHAFHDRLTSTLTSLPGVDGVGAVARALGSGDVGFTLIVDGQTTPAEVAFQTVTPGVFNTLRIPLRGRDFSPAERTQTAGTTIVNESFARRHFQGRDPLGQRIGFQHWRSLEIIGVAADIRPTDAAAEVEPTLFMPVELNRGFGAPTYVVRTRGPSAALVPSIRRAVADVDASAVVFDATPLESLLQRQVTTPKFYGLTATGFAAVAVGLAALGLYGVLSYSVNARTRELGIRIAVGATPRRLVASVMREALGSVVVGLVLGLAGAFYSSRFLEALLFGVRPHDPATLAGVAGLFLSVALIAAYLPARRAARVDPIVALRAE